MLSARYSKSKLAAYVLLSAAFVLIGIWILGQPDPSAEALFAAWVGIVFFGPGAVVLGRRLFDNGEVLRIDRMGVFDTRAMSRPVPWSAVEKMTEREIRHNVIFTLHLGPPLQDFVGSRAKRTLSSLNGLFGFGRNSLSIAANALNVSTDEVRAALAAHHRIGDYEGTVTTSGGLWR